MAKLNEIFIKSFSGEWGAEDLDGTGTPVLRTTNFTNHGVINYTDVVTRNIKKKNISDKYLSKGDIIIEKSGGSDKQPVGRVVFFDGEEGKYLFNNFTGLLRVKNKDEWLPRYVFYALFANYCVGGTRRYENRTTGLHNLQLDAYLSGTEIKKRNYEIQIEIVNNLDKVSELIGRFKEQLQDFDLLIKSRFIEMFGDIVLNDKHHGQYILNDVCVKITDGTHDTPKRIENGYLFLTGKNIRANGIIYDEIEYVSKEVHKEIYKRCNPEYGDVLYTNIGVNYGTACLNNRTDEFSMKNIALLKPNKKILNSYYLWYCLNLMRDFILEKNQAGGAQTFMGLATIKNIKIQVPSIELQNQFASFVQQVDKSKLEIQKSLEELETLKKSLMQQYFG